MVVVAAVVIVGAVGAVVVAVVVIVGTVGVVVVAVVVIVGVVGVAIVVGPVVVVVGSVVVAWVVVVWGWRWCGRIRACRHRVWDAMRRRGSGGRDGGGAMCSRGR